MRGILGRSCGFSSMRGRFSLSLLCRIRAIGATDYCAKPGRLFGGPLHAAQNSLSPFGLVHAERICGYVRPCICTRALSMSLHTLNQVSRTCGILTLLWWSHGKLLVSFLSLPATLCYTIHLCVFGRYNASIAWLQHLPFQHHVKVSVRPPPT